MFSAAFKNSLTERRHAVRVAAGVEQMEMAEGGGSVSIESDQKGWS